MEFVRFQPLVAIVNVFAAAEAALIPKGITVMIIAVNQQCHFLYLLYSERLQGSIHQRIGNASPLCIGCNRQMINKAAAAVVPGTTVEVHDEAWLAEHGFGGLLAVGSASATARLTGSGTWGARAARSSAVVAATWR